MTSIVPVDIRGYFGIPILMRDLLLLDLQRPWVIEPILGLGDRLVLVGPAKVGKTLLMTQLLTHVALGKGLWGYHTVPRRVLYTDFEMGLYTVIDRMKILNRSHPEVADFLWVQTRPASLEAAIDAMTEDCGGWPEVWVIDPLIAIGYTNENDNAEMRRRLAKVHEYSEMMGGPALIIVHHAGKPIRVPDAKQYQGLDLGRGASALAGWLDTQMTLMGELRKPERVLTIDTRLAEDQEPVSLLRDPRTLLYSKQETWDKVQESVAIMEQVRKDLGDVSQTIVVKEVARRLGVDGRTVYRRLAKGGGVEKGAY